MPTLESTESSSPMFTRAEPLDRWVKNHSHPIRSRLTAGQLADLAFGNRITGNSRLR